VTDVGGDGLVAPFWLVLCWTTLGSGFEFQRGHLFFGISLRVEISQEGFVQELVSPPATSRYIESVRIISEAPLVSEWMLISVKKDIRESTQSSHQPPQNPF
jgi:hypothetical protein